MAGRRLLALREERGLSAAQVVARIPESGITRNMIANLEGGRKRDLTVTEAMQLASALDVSVLALMVDARTPFAPVDVEGLAAPASSATMAEYGRAARVIGPGASENGGFTYEVSLFLDALFAAEMEACRCAAITSSLRNGVTPEEALHGVTASGSPWIVAAWEVQENGLIDSAQLLVSAYRGALRLIRSGKVPSLTEALAARVEALRLAVVNVLSEHAGLDYGQHTRADSTWGAAIPGPLDPATGREVLRDDFGGRSDG